MTAPTTAAGPAAARTPAADGVRAEIQGLRALAVTLVVAFHLWPQAVPGGYLGVDVFFVVSGFLIGGHLLRELDATGTIRLARFWARRARRLLPASLTVLAVVLVVTWLRAPAALQGRWLTETAGAVGYVLNWVLAGTAVQYSAADLAASPVQHFWSLSVEEQFYLAWPVLLLGTALAVRRLGPAARRRAPVAVAGVVLVASFAWSVRTSPLGPAAYFVTTTRAWEFAAGVLLAASGASVAARPVGVRRVLSAVAAVVITATAFVLGPTTVFPGWVAAVPVAAAALVVAAGDPDGRAWYRPRAVQRLGDWSYAAYLWHWPLVVLTPYVTRHVLTPAERVGLVAVTVALAAATKRFVEDPVRRRPVSGARASRTTFLAVATAMAVLLVLCDAGTGAAAAAVSRQRVRDAAVDLSGVACLGAAAGVTGPCDDPRVAGRVVPRPSAAFDDSVRYCLTGNEDSALLQCEFGVPLDRARHVVALAGDSHAAQWQAAFEVLARERGWHVYTFFKGSCQLSQAVRRASPGMQHACARWNDEVQQALRRLPAGTALVTTGKVSSEFVPGPGQGSSYAAGVDGYRAAWARLPGTVSDVWVLRDTPELGRDARQCLLVATTAQLLGPDRCGSPRADAVRPDPEVGAVRPLEGASGGRRYHEVDLTDLLCTATRCPAVIGHVVVYRDTHHLTATFARTLVPYLAERLDLDGL